MDSLIIKSWVATTSYTNLTRWETANSFQANLLFLTKKWKTWATKAVSESDKYKSARGKSQEHSFQWHYQQEGHGFCRTCSTKIVFTASAKSRAFWLSVFCACHRYRMSSYYSNWLLTFFVTCLPGRCLVILRQGFDLKCFRFSFLYCFTFWNPTASAAPLRSWPKLVYEVKGSFRMRMCYTHWPRSDKFQVFARYRQEVEC